MNQAFGGTLQLGTGPQLVAVPVLPATIVPGICAAVPVPLVTTLIIIWRIWSAVWGVIGRPYSCLSNSLMVRPALSRTSVTNLGAYSSPPLAITADSSASCRGFCLSLSSPTADRATFGRFSLK